MQSIDASNNLLSGALPATTFEGVWLESVDYSGNNLTGSIANNVTSYAIEVSQAVQKCMQVYMGLHSLHEHFPAVQGCMTQDPSACCIACY